MARAHGRIKTSIWTDDDFRGLHPDAQRLYFLLLSQPSLNMVGLLPYQPRRWAGASVHTDLADILGALADLVERRYVLVMLDTEELIIRTYCRHDVQWANPRMVKALSAHAAEVTSPDLRHALADDRKVRLKGEKEERAAEEIAALIADLDNAKIGDGIADRTAILNAENMPIDRRSNGDGIADRTAYPSATTTTTTTATTTATALAASSDDDDCSPPPIAETINDPPEPEPPQPSSSSDGFAGPPELADLAADLAAAIGPGTRWDRLNAIDVHHVVAAERAHGRAKIIDACRNSSYSGRPPGWAAIYVAAIRSLEHTTKPATHHAETPRTRCAVHDHWHTDNAPCPDCDRDTGPPDTRPADSGLTPAAAAAIAQMRASLHGPTDETPF